MAEWLALPTSDNDVRSGSQLMTAGRFIVKRLSDVAVHLQSMYSPKIPVLHCYLVIFITKTRLFKYIENFTTKNENFQIK